MQLDILYSKKYKIQLIKFVLKFTCISGDSQQTTLSIFLHFKL